MDGLILNRLGSLTQKWALMANGFGVEVRTTHLMGVNIGFPMDWERLGKGVNNQGCCAMFKG